MSHQYDEKTDAALDAIDANAISAADFEDADFRRLAMACLDQGGLTKRDLDRVAAIVDAAFPAPKVDALTSFIRRCASDSINGGSGRLVDPFDDTMVGSEMMPLEDES